MPPNRNVALRVAQQGATKATFSNQDKTHDNTKTLLVFNNNGGQLSFLAAVKDDHLPIRKVME